MYNEQDIAVIVQNRLNLPGSLVPRMQTLIPAALDNLAKAVAADPNRRPQLLTDPSVVTVNLALNSFYPQYVGDLSTVIAGYNILLDYIQYGTIWWSRSISFIPGDVHITPASYIILDDVDDILLTGTPVCFQVDPSPGLWALPGGLFQNRTYYIIADGAPVQDAYYFATSYDNAVAGTKVSISNVGDGTNLVVTVPQVVQWLQSPNQGSLPTCLPIRYPTVYLVGTTIYINNVSEGALSLSVPYIPTVAQFPDDVNLLSDLCDEIAALWVTKDLAAAQPTSALAQT